MIAFPIWIALSLGNFLYAYLRGGSSQDYEKAADRTIFQGLALMLAALNS